MARPQKQTQGHRRHRLSVRVTDEELALYAQRVKQAGLTSSDYLRQAALAARVTVSKTTRADPALIAQWNRIGVNLNQITRVANSTGRVSPILDRLCRKIEEIVMKSIDQEADHGPDGR